MNFQSERPPVASIPYEQRQDRRQLDIERRRYVVRDFNDAILRVAIPAAIRAVRVSERTLLVSNCTIQNPSSTVNMFLGFSQSIAAGGTPQGFTVPPFQNAVIEAEEQADPNLIEVFDLYNIFITFGAVGTYLVPYIWSVKR